MKHSIIKTATLAATLILAAPAYAQGVKTSRGVAEELHPIELATDVFGDVDDATSTMDQDPVISVTPVNHVSLDTLGLYDAKQGGVDFNVWEGSSHARVRELMEVLPSSISSDTVRALITRLLLSVTKPPVSENIQQNVLAMRVDALMTLGEPSQAARLLAQIPDNLITEKLAQRQFTAHLLNGDDTWVCANINAALGKYKSDALAWQRMAIYCHAKEGRQAEMQLAMNVLEEQESPLAAPFAEALMVEAGYLDKTSGDRLTGYVDLAVAAMLALMGADAFPKDYVSTAPLPVLQLILRQGTLPAYLKTDAEKQIKAHHALEKSNTAPLTAWLKSTWGEADTPVNASAVLAQLYRKGEGSAPSGDAAKALQFRMEVVAQALGFELELDTNPWSVMPLKIERTLTSPQLLAQLELAVADGKHGEALLLIGIIAGTSGSLSEWDDHTLTMVIQALQGLGLEDDARALAAEAVIAQWKAASPA